MITHYVVGVGTLLLLSVAWLGVQRAWRRSFSDMAGDPDALAGRSGCHGCSGSKPCHQKDPNGACEAQENPR